MKFCENKRKRGKRRGVGFSGMRQRRKNSENDHVYIAASSDLIE
jgi:hypothetical protein